MTMTSKQEKMYRMGQRLSEMYPDYNVTLALSYDCFGNGEIADALGAAEEAEAAGGVQNSVFFYAGYHDIEPRWETAIRFGEIPACGRSRNWAENTYENGVSCVHLGSEPKESIYDIIYGAQDIKKYLVEGWYLENYGSDGEPLLHNATMIAEVE